MDEPITVIRCRPGNIGLEVIRTLYKCRDCYTKFPAKERYLAHRELCRKCDGCHSFLPKGSIFSCEVCGALSPRNSIAEGDAIDLIP